MTSKRIKNVKMFLATIWMHTHNMEWGQGTMKMSHMLVKQSKTRIINKKINSRQKEHFMVTFDILM
jgi:hypothetical protein